MQKSSPKPRRRPADPFARPLDRHLQAARLAWGHQAYRRVAEHFDRWQIVCPRCVAEDRTSVVTEHGEGGRITFICSAGCRPEKIAGSARELEKFFLDRRDSTILPLRFNRIDGWSVKLPIGEFITVLEEAA